MKIFTITFAICTGFLIWTLSYAGMMSVFYNDDAIISKIGEQPFIAFRQLYTYWQNETVQSLAFFSLFPSLFVTFGIIYVVLRERDPVFGDAKFATKQEIRRAKLFSKKGVILGRVGGSIMRADDDRHHLIIGPTRSGKGTNYVVPNMLEWKGSILVTDLKGELWAQTSSFRRSQGNSIFLFAPAQANTHRYNPMDFIRHDRGSRTTDIQNMANILIPIEANSSSAIWAATSRSILSGLISYVSESVEYKGRRNFGEINTLLSTGIDLQTVFKTIIQAEKNLSNFTIQTFNNYISLPEKTAQSALLDIQRATAIFKNEQILASTMVTDIDIRNLQRKPMSIYLAPNISDISLLMPLMRLFVQQTLDQLLIEFDANALPAFFLLDEFRQLGKMDEIVTKLPYVAGYKIKMSFIIQDLKSLDEIYGESTRQSMLGNCGYQLVLGANDQATADYVSKALGKTTVTYETTSVRRQLAGIHQRTRNENVKERDLLMPQEVRGLDGEKLVMLIEGQKPVYGSKIRSYKERPWSKWAEQSEATVAFPEPVEFVNFKDAPVVTSEYYKKYDCGLVSVYKANEEFKQNPESDSSLAAKTEIVELNDRVQKISSAKKLRVNKDKQHKVLHDSKIDTDLENNLINLKKQVSQLA